ncbi:Nucleotidyl transferase [mine drainage metagenome]|uniref:Nucleotidyl transferase n=1 Tax=mine drainage metagenome TaxID=410659 RepID=T1D144_9ZZZZ
MKAIALVGGLGTRLRPITYDLPKQLIPLAGRSMLYRALDVLPDDLEEVVLATGYKSEQIAAYVHEHSYRLPIRTVPETQPLGTGGGMRNVADGMSDPFFVINSDIVSEASAAEVLRVHEQRNGIGALLLARVEETQTFGVAALGENDRITQFVEKPAPGEAPSPWINAGISVWRREVLDRIPTGREVSFEREILPGLLERGVYGARLRATGRTRARRNVCCTPSGSSSKPAKGVEVHLPSGASGTGPVSVGPGARAVGATFGPLVTLGAGVVVGEEARISNSILMDGARIDSAATVVGSILGPRAHVGAGHRVADQVLGAGGEA